MSELKLIALDAVDLQVISAHLQDAVGRIGDITYEKTARRFVMLLNRFDWAQTGKKSSYRPSEGYERHQSALRFEKVEAVRTLKVERSKPNEVLSLLAIGFEAGEAPSGTVTLFFSGGPQIALDVEYIEAELRDLGAAWTTKRRPRHPGIEDGV
jgi:Protein of unknown function (DUF2948)